jgi:transcriptional regulator with XRE-family HTH domain
MEPIPKSIGHTLRERRRNLGLSQAKVAELTGKTQPQIARLEQGLGEPGFSTVVEVARSLGAELVAIPVRLLPAVRSLISSFDRDTRDKDGSSTRMSAQLKPRKLVGNDPDDPPPRNYAVDWPLEDE